MQFHSLGDTLGADQALREIEAGIDVPLRDIDHFPIERDGTLACRIKRLFPTFENLFEGVLRALIEFPALSDVLLGEYPHRFRHLRVFCELLEFLGRLAICARRVGGHFRRGGLCHGMASWCYPGGSAFADPVTLTFQRPKVTGPSSESCAARRALPRGVQYKLTLIPGPQTSVILG